MSAHITLPIARTGARAICRFPRPLVQKRLAGGHAQPAINHDVTESLGVNFWLLFAAVPTFTVLYKLAQPGEDGEQPVLTQWMQRLYERPEKLREQDALHTKACEQVASDKQLLWNAAERPEYQMRTPDMIYAGSPRNIPASHYVDLDAVKESYRKKYWDEVERREAKMAARKQAGET